MKKGKKSYKKMGKKGYVRTLEAFLAFFLTFLFTVFVVLKGVPQKPERAEFHVLENLEQQKGFRDCVYAENITCMDTYVQQFIPRTHGHKLSLNNPDPPIVTKSIFTETGFMTGNQTNDYKVIYLYYWVVG